MLAVMVVGSLLATGAAGQDKGKTDKDKIQGKWLPVSLEKGGIKAPEEEYKKVKLAFTGDKITVVEDAREMAVTFKLDPAKKPKQIDVTESRNGKDEVHEGIYELDGDKLKICFAHAQDPRPRDFVSQAGTSQTLIVLTREKN